MRVEFLVGSPQLFTGIYGAGPRGRVCVCVYVRVRVCTCVCVRTRGVWLQAVIIIWNIFVSPDFPFIIWPLGSKEKPFWDSFCLSYETPRAVGLGSMMQKGSPGKSRTVLQASWSLPDWPSLCFPRLACLSRTQSQRVNCV